jgi:beta-galactosidase
LEWDVPFEAGKLEAIGKRDGKVVASEQINTTGDPAVIEMSADTSSLAADGRDVAHLTVKILDANQQTVPTAGNEITIDIDGPGRIIGMDNGDPTDHDSFKTNHRKAFNGLCLAIVQMNRHPGRIYVTAHSPGLRDAAVELVSRTADQSVVLP